MDEWRRRENPRFEDKILHDYWQSVGGIIYAEVPVGRFWISRKSDGSKVRFIDGVRIPGTSGDSNANIITFPYRAVDSFKQNIKSKHIEVIEIKRKLNRPVIGQAMIAADLFVQEYQCAGVTTVIVCKKTDGLMEDYCKRRGIKIIVI